MIEGFRGVESGARSGRTRVVVEVYRNVWRRGGARDLVRRPPRFIPERLAAYPELVTTLLVSPVTAAPWEAVHQVEELPGRRPA